MAARTDYLVPYLNENDKGPSWDGYILAYRTAGDNHSKSDLSEKIFVQVKGQQSDHLNDDSIKYSVEISDLNNYLEFGGTVYLVVCFDENGDNETIYYNALLPFNIKKIIRHHRNQKTHSISLRRMPLDRETIAEIFLDFATNSKLQKGAIRAENVTVERLVKDQGKIPELFMEFNSVGHNYLHPIETIIGKDLFINARIPYNMSLPVDFIPNVEYAVSELPVHISADGKQFYNIAKVCADKENTVIYLGTSFVTTFNRKNHQGETKISIAGKLSERIRDQEFIITAFEDREVVVNGNVLSVDSMFKGREKEFNYEKRTENLLFLRKTADVLRILGVNDDLDYDSMTKKDEAVLTRIVSGILDQNLVALPLKDSTITTARIANIDLLLYAAKDEDSGLFKLFNVLDSPVQVMSVMEDGTEIPSTFCITLDHQALLKYSNMSPDLMMQNIRDVPYNDDYEAILTLFMLEVLKAVDIAGAADGWCLRFAEDVCDYITENSKTSDKTINELNKLQIKKRKGSLTDKELRELRLIIDRNQGNHSVLTGAYILLDDYLSAEKHYSFMEKKEREEFDNFPINYFWKKAPIQ